ncbi:hypothetical protein Ancab_021238 [Ancistrocladus abbreviatus]
MQIQYFSLAQLSRMRLTVTDFFRLELKLKLRSPRSCLATSFSSTIMAKKASKTQKARPSSSASRKTTAIPPDDNVGLKAKSTKNNTNMVLEEEESEDDVTEEVRRPTALKKRKTTLNKTKKKKKKKIKPDARKPKKPPTAFFYFLEDFRKAYQEQNPEVKSMRDIGKACGEKWKIMTYEEKVQYYDIATEKRAEFDRAMAEYIRRQETGEDLEPEDSEFDDE